MVRRVGRPSILCRWSIEPLVSIRFVSVESIAEPYNEQGEQSSFLHRYSRVQRRQQEARGECDVFLVEFGLISLHGQSMLQFLYGHESFAANEPGHDFFGQACMTTWLTFHPCLGVVVCLSQGLIRILY